jgi:hypothetical protein
MVHGSDRVLSTATPDREDERREEPAAGVAVETPRPAQRTSQLTPSGVLALQRGAGNQAVAGLLSRQGARIARLEAGPHVPAHDTVNNYVALANGLNNLVQRWRNPAAIDVTPSAETDLLPRHRALLGQLQSALKTIKTAPGSALSLWEAISPSFYSELRRGGIAGLNSDDLAGPLSQLDYLTHTLFQPGAYYEAKHEAREASDLESPDSAFEKEKVERAEQEFNTALQLLEMTKKLGSGFPHDAKVAGAMELVEVAALRGGLEEKLEYARKHGIAVTAADLAGKLLGATKGLVKVSGEIGEKIYEAKRAAAAARGAVAVAKQMEGQAKSFSKMAETAERIGKVGTALTLLGDYIRLVAALADGDYDAAMAAGLDLATDAAPLVFGADLAGPLAVAVVVVKAELEAFRSAAAFIRYCKDENVRQAAGSFIDVCDRILKGAALDLVADCELLLDPTRQSLHQIAEQQAVKEGQRVAAAFTQLNSHVLSTEPLAIGAYRSVVQSLGQPALAALAMPFPDPLLAAQQCRDVFHGANAMAAYVRATYTN